MRFLTIAAIIAVTVANVAPAAKDPALPHHKPGLWQNDAVTDGRHSSNQSCFDDASEMKMRALSEKHCSAHRIAHNPDGSWTTDSTCTFAPGAERTSHSRITGDFNAKITLLSQTSTGTQTAITSTWIGPCKPDQQGGAVVMSNGAKINMLDVMSSRGPAKIH